ncbi:luc7-like protein 3 isoform 1 [Planoprotostelium fungivorum]|nr:luc7-like protein 3 isoform 1 [Planoprotostelium fungivorum]
MGEPGEIVWVKFGSYPMWPAKVTPMEELPKKVKDKMKHTEDQQIVYFFGSEDYAAVAINGVQKWEEGYEKNKTPKKGGKQFIKALKQAEFWLKHKRHMDPEDEEEGEEASTPKTKRSRRSSAASTNGDDSAEERISLTQDSRSPSKEKGKKEEKKRDRRKSRDAGSDDEGKRKRTHNEEKSPRRTSRSSNRENEDKSVETPDHSHEHNGNTSKSDIVSTPSVDRANRKQINSANVAAVTNSICKHPIAKYFKFAVVEDNVEGTVTAKAYWSENRPDIQAEVHPSVSSLHFLMDITAYLACLNQLNESEDAVTIVLQKIPKASVVTLKAHVLQFGDNNVIVECEAYVSEQSLVAKAKVIKSIVHPDVPLSKEATPTTKKKED